MATSSDPPSGSRYCASMPPAAPASVRCMSTAPSSSQYWRRVSGSGKMRELMPSRIASRATMASRSSTNGSTHSMTMYSHSSIDFIWSMHAPSSPAKTGVYTVQGVAIHVPKTMGPRPARSREARHCCAPTTITQTRSAEP
eukprot:scaffold63701_cov65-Phaeocystis_antarctica.AAC.5